MMWAQWAPILAAVVTSIVNVLLAFNLRQQKRDEADNQLVTRVGAVEREMALRFSAADQAIARLDRDVSEGNKRIDYVYRSLRRANGGST